MSELLRVQDLSISLPMGDGSKVDLVERVNLSVSASERVAIVGETGSGKSLTARALMGLDPELPVSGSIKFKGQELVGLSEKEFRKIRGGGIGMVFQDPLSALNPLMRIGDLITEPLRGTKLSSRAASDKARQILEELGVSDAAGRMRAYPHQFSGGMRQRVVLAMALIADPELLIADEPTTALDVRVQAQVLSLLAQVAETRQLAVLFITHDVGVVGDFASSVKVMYSGKIIEEGSANTFFRSPSHPYTRGLLSAVPRPTGHDRLISMAGSPPAPAARPTGCVFSTRCPYATELCVDERPELRESVILGARVACHYAPTNEKAVDL